MNSEIKNSKTELKPTKQKQGEKNYEKFEKKNTRKLLKLLKRLLFTQQLWLA